MTCGGCVRRFGAGESLSREDISAASEMIRAGCAIMNFVWQQMDVSRYVTANDTDSNVIFTANLTDTERRIEA